jgi:hypothetical protein
MIQGSEAEVEAAGGSYSKRSAVGTVNWGTATLVGVFAGLLYGGSKEASASVVSGDCTLVSLPLLLLRLCASSRLME